MRGLDELEAWAGRVEELDQLGRTVTAFQSAASDDPVSLGEALRFRETLTNRLMGPVRQYVATSGPLITAEPADSAFTGLGIGALQQFTSASLAGTQQVPLDGRLTSDAVFQLAVHGASPVTITVPAAATSNNQQPANLLVSVNAALVAAGIVNVVAELASGDVLQFRTTDLVAGVPSLRLTAAAGNAAVTQLHFATDQTSDGQKAVASASDTLATRTYIDRFNLTATAGLSGTNLNGTASYGIVAVDINGGLMTSTQTIQVSRPGMAPTKLATMIELLNQTASPYTATYGGTASFTLPVQVQGNVIPVTGAVPRVSATANNLFSTPAITVQAVDAPQLENLKNLQFQHVATLLGDIGTALQTMVGTPTVVGRLPFVNSSPGGLVPVAVPYRDAIAQLATAGTLQQMTSVIAAAFGLPSNAVTLSMPSTNDLRLSFTYTTAGTAASAPLSLDLAALSTAAGGVPNVAGLSELAQSSGSSVQVTASGITSPTFGFGLSPSSAPSGYLLDTSTTNMSVDALANNVSFQSSLGALGVNVTGGNARLSNGVNPATYLVRLNTVSGGKYTPMSINVGHVNVVKTGSANVNLPTNSTTLGGGLSPLIADIPNIANTTTAMSAPNLAQIINGMSLTNNYQMEPAEIRRYFQGIQSLLNRNVLAVNLPVVCQSLTPLNWISDLGNELADGIPLEAFRIASVLDDSCSVFHGLYGMHRSDPNRGYTL